MTDPISEPALMGLITAVERALLMMTHRDRPSLETAEKGNWRVVDALRSLAWVSDDEPLFAHFVADAWRLHALVHQPKIESRHVAGVRDAALRRLAQIRQRVIAYNARLERSHRALLEAER